MKDGLSKKIVITGASSFVGCHLAVKLSRAGYRVIITISGKTIQDADIRSKRLQWIHSEGIDAYPLDMTQSKELALFIEKIRPDYWIQHAGWTKNHNNFDYDLERAGQLNNAVLQPIYKALSNVACKGLIITGSEAEYGEALEAHCEDELSWPLFPYGLSKLSETIYAKQLSEYYRLPARVARLFIPYGPMDNATKLIPSAMQSLFNNQPLLLTDCEHYRDFTYIDDVVNAYLLLLSDLSRDSVFDIFNIASGQGVQLKELLLEMAKQIDGDTQVFQFGRKPKKEKIIPCIYGDNTKMRSLLGWKVRGFQEGLKEYINIMRKC